MHSLSFPYLLGKEVRELFAARAFWIMLLMVGVLVGHGFITSINLFAEMSGNGGPAALPQGLTPLDGILVPTWGAYDLAATLLFPFVAIRLIAAEKESGSLKLLLQLPGSLATKISAKALALLAGWLIAWAPGLLSIALWKSYGGHLYLAETVNLLAGHFLRGFLSAGLAVAAAGITESASSAAIITLGFTVGCWALDFIAAGRGGWLQTIAAYTPTSSLRQFEQGLFKLSTVVVVVVLALAGFALATIWVNTGRTFLYRMGSTVILILVAAGICFVSANVQSSYDRSENRRNSFSIEDEAALRQVTQSLKITVFLAPEDPRLADLEGVLKKLRRALGRRLTVDYSAQSRSGLFEGAEDHYGEIWFEMNGKKVVDRSTIEEVVLDQVYQLSGVSVPERSLEDGYPGYPLSTQPKGSKLIFYFLWPLVVIVTWWFSRRY